MSAVTRIELSDTVRVTRNDISNTIKALIRAVGYSGHLVRSDSGYVLMTTGVAKSNNGGPPRPSIQDVVRELINLPSDDPLRRCEKRIELALKGYGLLERLHFDPRKTYEDLNLHLAPPI